MRELLENKIQASMSERQRRKDAYRSLCQQEESIPIFSQAWWLDALAGTENWDVALVEKSDRVVASLPYVSKRRYGMISLGMPPETPTLGPWLRETKAKQAKRLGYEKDILKQLILGLPNHSHYCQNWHHTQTNWLPFYWAGFKQTTRYTYRLPDLSDGEKIWDGFQANIRTDIRKATDRFSLKIRTDLSIQDFLTLNEQTYERQGMRLPYPQELVVRLDQACHQRKARQIFIAEDARGRRHAAVYIIWDQRSAYYLMGGGDPALRHSGATSLCLWDAIRFAANVTKSFDFEGSMIEPIERFFRAFGAELTPYFTVSRTQSNLMRAYFCLREFSRKR